MERQLESVYLGELGSPHCSSCGMKECANSWINYSKIFIFINIASRWIASPFSVRASRCVCSSVAQQHWRVAFACLTNLRCCLWLFQFEADVSDVIQNCCSLSGVAFTAIRCNTIRGFLSVWKMSNESIRRRSVSSLYAFVSGSCSAMLWDLFCFVGIRCHFEPDQWFVRSVRSVRCTCD